MAAVANITEVSNAITYPKVISDLMAPAFLKAVCMMNHMTVEDLPQNATTKQWQKDGSLTAAALAESTALAINSNGELTRSEVDGAVSKCAVSSGLSVEALQFTNLDLPTIAERQANAIARFVDDTALALLGGLSTTVTSAALLTLDDVMLGQMNIYKSECPNKEVPLSAVISHKSHYSLKKEIVQSGAAVWTNNQYLTILQGAPQANCYVGSFGNIQFFATSGFATAGGDDKQGIFHPMWTFAGMFSGSPVLVQNMRGAEGLYLEAVSYYFYSIVEWNDLAGVFLSSDS
jgi:hypothetical protein